MLTNPVWLVKTRLQLQAPGHGAQKPYSGFTGIASSVLFNSPFFQEYID